MATLRLGWYQVFAMPGAPASAPGPTVPIAASRTAGMATMRHRR
ncbi:hypothetical protein I545_1215 [Mycobacterium kansasii 662]|uniref:Uncharacterized protein n=2 Tax=Mycobacterium kansasii TaxID=1768 RepID=A0A1V3XY16_MYCKA|nr:hypothetical protein I545_1215 [Mycobacterium kansasii 662]OOK84114.1 hypothetical protein BZL29_1484 [Mycobacterium kansasii]